MSVEKFDPNSSTVSLTEKAIKHFEGKLKDNPNQTVRLSTKVSGCTGYAYVLEFVDAPEADDELVEFSPALSIAIAKDSTELLKDTEIDYVLEGVNGVIKYRNPNVVNECGCGESFNVG